MFQWTSMFHDPELAGKAVVDLLAAAKAKGLDPRRTVVLANAGLELAVNMRDPLTPPTQSVANLFPGIMAALAPVGNAGGHIGWRLSTHICCSKHGMHYSEVECFKRTEDLLPRIARLTESNVAIGNMLRSSYPSVGVVDGWALTNLTFLGGMNGTCQRYEDWVHAPLLAPLQIQSWIADVLRCPCSGGSKSIPGA